MNRLIASLAVLIITCVGAFAAANPTLTVETMTATPADAVIVQDALANNGAEYDNATQVRFRSNTDRRGVYQVITWEGDTGMTGFAFRLAKVQQQTDGFPLAVYDNNQNMEFDLQEVSPEGIPGKTLVQRVVTVPNGIVQPGAWLYFKFSEPVALQAGQRYVAHLLPNTVDSNNRLFIDTAIKSDPYPGGFGRQSRGMPMVDTYAMRLPAGTDDLGFFATAGQ